MNSSKNKLNSKISWQTHTKCEGLLCGTINTDASKDWCNN